MLAVDNLSVSIGARAILSDVSFAIAPGEILALVGESGSGKSTTALALLGLLPPAARQAGAIGFAGTPLPVADDRAMSRYRGAAIGYIAQEPMTALDPLMTIGDQVAETLRQHRLLGRRAARAAAREMLDRVGLAADRFPLTRYPHELSGGERQRVAIAMAVALAPRLLIADEPTTALDVTTQAQILDLLKDLVADHDMALLLITHDLGVVAGIADRVAILRAGTIVETGATKSVFAAPSHPYTERLVAASAAAPDRLPARAREAALLEVDGVVRTYRGRRAGTFGHPPEVRALDGVSLTLARGESLGIVGESGSGKSTLLRTILALDRAQAGEVRLDGARFAPDIAPRALRRMRRRIQLVFQDPYASFDPRWRVDRIVGEPLALLDDPPSGAARADRIAAMLARMGLAADDARRFAHQFSGGERQRIAIARALIVAPEIVALDEAVSALDVTTRARILDLLNELAAETGVAYLFIAHDLAVVRAITDRVAVMRAGRIVETGDTETVFAAPQHDYTRALLAATPTFPGGA